MNLIHNCIRYLSKIHVNLILQFTLHKQSLPLRFQNQNSIRNSFPHPARYIYRRLVLLRVITVPILRGEQFRVTMSVGFLWQRTETVLPGYVKVMRISCLSERQLACQKVIFTTELANLILLLLHLILCHDRPMLSKIRFPGGGRAIWTRDPTVVKLLLRIQENINTDKTHAPCPQFSSGTRQFRA
jgi:hypothetical protein